MLADDLALTEEQEMEVIGVFEEWKAALESKGLKVNIESQYGENKVNSNW